MLTHRALSQPLQVEWAGWRTNTFKLQQAGWSLSANQDIGNRTMRIAMEHKALQMRAITHTVDFNYAGLYEGYRHDEYLRTIVLPVHLVGREVILHEHGSIDWTAFKPVDATPAFITYKISRLQDLVHFAPAQARTKERIVPQENVEELLDRILKMQDPARMERLREEVRHPEGRLLTSLDADADKTRFEAQIISIAA